MKGMVTLEEDRCKACAVCLDACPRDILVLSEGRFNTKGYRPVEVTDMERCTGCALCAVVCPDVVFTVYREGRRVKNPPAEAVANA